MKKQLLVLCSLMSLWAPATSWAEEPKKDQPLEITADKSLEWYQDRKLYVARGSAKAIKGGMTITANLLTAHQRDEAKPKGEAPKAAGDQNMGGGDIDWMTAEGVVHIFDDKQQIFGDRAVYETDKKLITVTGNKLKYITKFEVVTARDALIYDEGQDIAVARGKARALHEKSPEDKRQIEADVLTATFAVGPDGKKEMTRMYADGNVTVITKTDISRGDHAVYDAKQNNAVLTGHVKITHGTSQLAGDAARTDFTTGQSRILKDDNSRRARAVVPPQPKKPETDESADHP